MSHLSKKGKEKEDSFDSKEKDYDLSDNNDETDDDVFISDLDHRRQQARLIIKKNQIRKKNYILRLLSERLQRSNPEYTFI